jgi:hypothetical protein
MFAKDARTVGTLAVPTGKIRIGDNIMRDFKQLTRWAPMGQFPVEVSLAKAKDGETRVAAVRILFSPQSIETWELAPEVDFAGTMWVAMDTNAAPAFDALIDEAPASWWLQSRIRDRTQVGQGWRFGAVDLTEALNFAFSSAGEYEGTNHSYWALDRSGMPVMLATNFNVVG